jgi:hypothetical protein
MKNVVHIDKNGFKRVYTIRDKDPDSVATQGIPVGPPDIRVLDWNEIVKETNNLLVDNGILSYEDLNRNNNGISQVINVTIRTKIMALYKEQKLRS